MAFLEVRNLSKSFPGVVALRDVDIAADLGEVHAIVGANGAGKTTLMNILAGALAPSAGEVCVNGQQMAGFSPLRSRELGISAVYQDLNLVAELSVARNVFLGREPAGRFGLIDRDRLMAETSTLLDHYRFGLRSGDVVGDLTVAQRQLVEIARALSIEARVLILDEPTAVLSLAEQSNLFDIILNLKRDNLLTLYVSHRLGEIFEIADRVSVLRDGRKIATVSTDEIEETELVRMMIGHEVRQSFHLPDVDPTASPVLQAVYRSGAQVTELALRPGEIVGLAGFVGAGRSYLARALVGLGGPGEATVRVQGEARKFRTPEDAFRDGIIYLTEDRKRDGLFSNLSILTNATAAALPLFSRLGVVRGTAERQEGGRILKQLRLVARSLHSPITELSGGNQQKVVFGRALLREPRVLICDEPTRGIDVGAKDEIYDLLIELAARGVAIILISSEVKELLAITHRILVMRDRAVVEEFETRGAAEDEILLAATGVRGTRPRGVAQ
ncbi:MAG: sugar ABC transporter ATP-binding protein [Alphaproteobacteria bacterium]